MVLHPNETMQPMEVDHNKELSVVAIADRQRLPAAETAELLASVRFKAPSDDESKNDRPPIKLSAVLDRSGSMQGPKLNMCKGSIKYAVKQMTSRDHFGLVTYDDCVKEEFPMSRMTDEAKKICLRRIDLIKDGGCTNLEGGLFAGIKQAGAAQTAVPVVIGNTHAAADGNNHSWTLYVRCADPQLIKKVEFKRDPSSETEVVTAGAPTGSILKKTVSAVSEFLGKKPETQFEISGVTWGVSTVAITVHYSNGTVKTYTHNLNFDSGRTEHSVDSVSPAPTDAEVDTPTAVWLFTDGLANSGKLYRNPPALYQEVRDRCRGTNTLVSTFGYGEDHDPKMLRGICEAGRGQYNYIENEGIIPEAFGACLGGLLSVAATNIKATIIPTSGVEIVKIISDFEHNKDGAGATVISIPDLYEEEQRDIVVSIRVPALPSPQEGFNLVAVSAVYENILTKKQGTCACTMVMDRPAAVTDPGINVELDVQKNRIEAAEAMKLAREKADAKELDLARELIAKAKVAIGHSPSAQLAYCVDLVDDLDKCDAGMKSAHEYRTKGCMYMNSSEMGHRAQRGMNWSKPSQYGTSKKKMHSKSCKTACEEE